MMLPEFWRFRIKSSLDETLTYDNAARIETHVTPWKMTSGAMVQGSLIEDTTDFLNTGENVAAAGEVEGATHDNTSDLFIGFTGLLYCIADVSGTDGTLDLYLETSYDGILWPSDLADFDLSDLILLARLPMTTGAVDEGRAIAISY